MNTIVASFTKMNESSASMSSPTTRTIKVMKPVKVPTWMRDMSLETYIKQLETWTEINEYVPMYVKYQDLIESLKLNKDIISLPRFVGEHVLSVLEKKTDQTVKKVFEVLDVKYGRT